MTVLPDGWETRAVGDIADIVRGVTYKKSDAKSAPSPGYSPLLRATNIGSSLDLGGDMVYVPTTGVKEQQFLRSGDIVLASSSGSLSVVGKNARLLTDWDGTFGAFCAVIRSRQEVDSRYLALYLSSDRVRRRWSEAARGTNINNLKKSDLAPTPVPVPPLEEQRRIADILEDHASRLDAAGLGLAQVRTRLDLLWRISLMNLCPAGVEAQPVTIGNVAHAIRGVTYSKPDLATSESLRHMPLLRATNFDDGVMHEAALVVQVDRNRVNETQILRTGDVLLSSSSGSLSAVGKSVLVDASAESRTFGAFCAVLRPNERVVPAFLAYWVRRPDVRRLWSETAAGTNINNLKPRDILATALSIPNLADQHAAVSRLSELENIQDRVQGEVEKVGLRSAKLRNSLLAAAFSGRLTGRSTDMELVEEMASV